MGELDQASEPDPDKSRNVRIISIVNLSIKQLPFIKRNSNSRQHARIGRQCKKTDGNSENKKKC